MPPQLTQERLRLCGVRGVIHVTDRAICVFIPLIMRCLDYRVRAADSEVMVRISEEVMIAEVLIRLGAAYPESSAGEVERCVRNAQEHFQSSPIREFVPLLVERRARAELARPAVGV